MKCDQLNVSAFFEILINAVAIVSLSPCSRSGYEHKCHDFGVFTALCFADSKNFYFAVAKVPSKNTLQMSIPTRL
jgi:hypothetical protein